MLDVETAGSESGLNVHVWDRTGASNQKWYIYGESGAYYLKPQCSDCVLDLNSGVFSEGVNAQIWTRNDTAAQKFQILGLNAPSSSYLHVAAGSNYTPTAIWWVQSENTTKYDLRIYKGKVWEGEPYKTVFGTTETSVSIDLPSGYYEASIASVNNFTYTLGQNTVGFTVSDGEIVDIGDDVYANIIRNDDWQALADIDGNVCINNDKNNIWHFRKLDDGGYTIQNTSTGGYLDLNNFTDENCANIQTWEYNGTSAQIWYIYGRWSGEYYFKPKCTSSRVLDVDRDSGNAQVYDLLWNNNQKMAIWGLNKPEAANLSYSVGNKYTPTRIWWNATQDTNKYTLKIYKGKVWESDHIELATTDTLCSVAIPAGYYEAYVDSSNDYSYTMSNNVIKFTVKESTLETIDTNFYAYIVNTNTDAYLINNKNGNACFNNSNSIDELQKVWYFTRNDDNSFTVTSVFDNGVLDAHNFEDSDGTNVEIFTNNGGANQKWYIQGESPNYYFKPAYTDRVLDLNGGVYSEKVNAQIWTRNETDAQKNKIVVVEKPVVSYNMNGGSGTIKAQTKELGKDLTLSLTRPTRTDYNSNFPHRNIPKSLIIS